MSARVTASAWISRPASIGTSPADWFTTIAQP